MRKVNVCYKFEGLIINQGDIVEVQHKDPFTDRVSTYKGRIIESVLGNKLKLDNSKAYQSSIIELELDEIIDIKYIG